MIDKFVRAVEVDNEYTDDGAIVTNGLVTLNDAAAILVMTLADPGEAGLCLTIIQKDAGTMGHTVTAATANAFDGANNVATFNAKREALFLKSISATEWIILANIGGVVLS